MKTDQFIKEIKSMGLRVQRVEDYMCVLGILGFHVAKTSMKEFGLISTNNSEFIKLDYNTKLQLLDLLIEYAKTPIEDREDEEKFKLKQKGISGKYLIWIPELDKFTTGSSPFSNVEGIFTQSEIDDMPECYKHPAVWEKIKVEREEE